MRLPFLAASSSLRRWFGGARWRALVSAALTLLLAVALRGCNSSGGLPGGLGPPGCFVNNQSCSSGTDCCSGICNSGSCACADFGAPCAGDDDCCTKWSCLGGVCSFGCRADGNHCGSDDDCCGKSCVANVCGPPRCLRSSEVCDNGTCCDGLACVKGATDADASSHKACEPGCNTADAPCGGASGTPCCEGFFCQDGLCTALCRGIGHACTADNQCCADFRCSGGTCGHCASQFGSCKTDGDCCGGSCRAGQCQCQPSGQACSSTADCCGRLNCRGGECGCAAHYQPCAADSDCCDGLACTDGICEPLGCFGYGATCVPGTGTQCCEGCGTDGHCCVSDGGSCAGGRACCQGEICSANKCVPCHGDGKSCSANGECCGGHCESGACCVAQRGAPCGGALGGGVNCCAGLECGYTSSVCCLGAGAACSADADCCQGVGWGCHGGRCCATPGPYSTCKIDQDCCPGSKCAPVSNSVSACCLPTGSACTTTERCCNGQCANGSCP